MQTIKRNTIIDIVDHVEHYSNLSWEAEHKRIVKVNPYGSISHGYYVSYSDEDHTLYHAFWVVDTKSELLDLIRHLLCGFELNEDDCGDFFLNQAWRDAWIERVTPTRVRIGYEMPNAGTVGGWHHIPRIIVPQGRRLFWSKALKRF